CDRDATRSPSPPNPIGSVVPAWLATPLHRATKARRVASRGTRPGEPIDPASEVGVRHGDHTRRRRIGVEGGGRGRRPGRPLGLARHPAPPLLRLPLPLLRSRGCFGCCDKAVKQLGDLSRNLITHDQIPIGEPFWSTTTIEVEPSDLRGSSSINISTWGFDQHGTGSSHNLPELGNTGRVLWEQTRQEWTEIRSLRPKVKQVREPVLSWNAAYESLLGSNKPFPQPIPLHEMVDFLVDIWEQEGLYD
ncbi:unnamed protein product, partial [Urochloa humidicola]